MTYLLSAYKRWHVERCGSFHSLEFSLESCSLRGTRSITLVDLVGDFGESEVGVGVDRHFEE